MMDAMSGGVSHLDAVALSRYFGVHGALQSVDLSVTSGEALALVGPNGAGKSTLLRLLAGAMTPTSGQICLNETVASTAVLRGAVGYVSHQPMVYPQLTSRENLAFFAHLRGVASIGYLEQWCARLQMASFFASPRAQYLSRGQLQRLSMACALVASPGILLLDEPTTGLDKEGCDVVGTIVASHLEGGGMIVFASHDVRFVQQCATAVVGMRAGTVTQRLKGPVSMRDLCDLGMAGELDRNGEVPNER